MLIQVDVVLYSGTRMPKTMSDVSFDLFVIVSAGTI